LYMTRTKICSNESNSLVGGPSLGLWQRRLGYTSKKGLHILVNKSTIPHNKGMSLNLMILFDWKAT